MENSSWIRKMFEEGIRLKKEFGEENVFDLSLGNPVIEPPEEVRKALIESARDESHGLHRYMPNAGLADVRAVIAESLSPECKVELSANDVVMVCGAAGGLNITLKTLLDPGDEVIIFAPYFVVYLFYADNHGGKAVAVPTLDKKITFDGVEAPNIMEFYQDSIYITSHSKDIALPGERIGFLAVHPQCESAGLLMAGLIFCNRVLGFVNAPALIQRVVKQVQGVTVDVEQYRRKRDYLYNELTRIGYQVVKPQGAFYFFPKSPLEDEVEFVKKLADKKVLVVPGRGFGLPGYFRISYCLPDSVIEGSIAGFEKAYHECQA